MVHAFVIGTSWSIAQVEVPAPEQLPQEQFDFASFTQCLKGIITDVDNSDVEAFKKQPISIHMLIA